MRGSFDLILMTGDLATTGLHEDLNHALRYVDAPATNGYRSSGDMPTLKAAGRPTVLLPGNHDRYGSVLARPNCQAFNRVFEAYWAPPPVNGSRSAVQVSLFRSDSERLAIACVDFTLKCRADSKFEPFGSWGRGRAYQDRLAQLKYVTGQVRKAHDPIAVVWAMHFPQLHPERKMLLRLIDGAKVARMAHRLGVPFILAGHVHSARSYELGERSVVVVSCAGTACSVDVNQMNAINISSIDVKAGVIVGVETETYNWIQARNGFIHEDTRVQWPPSTKSVRSIAPRRASR